MPQDCCRSLGQCLKMRLEVFEQKVERVAMMVMRDHPPRDTPEPFDAVSVRIIGRSINQVQMLLQFGKHAAYKQGAS